MKSDTPGGGARALRVGFVPGVTPDKWARVWAERKPRVPLEVFLVEEPEQVSVLYDGRADMCLVRLPVDQDGLHVIPLYSEVPVVVAARGHFVEAADEVSVADLADEHLLQDPAQVPEWAELASEVRDGSRVDVPPITMQQAIETVAAGCGIVIVPMSVARLHHRKDVVLRPVIDVAETRIGLAWRRDLDDGRFEAFIGVVRGRTANSSRGSQAPETPRKPVSRRTARGGRRR